MLKSIRVLDPKSRKVHELLSPPDAWEGILWLDVQNTSIEDTQWLQQRFGFHPLALEDCLRDHQRPKAERYGDVWFVVADLVALENGRVIPQELDVFWGPNFLVTLHSGEFALSQEILDSWCERNELEGSAGLFYQILDRLVDDYFPIVDVLGDRLERQEDLIFSSSDERAMHHAFRIRKELGHLRRFVVPLRDAVLVLMRQDKEWAHLPIYLQDVYDHLTRIAEGIDTQRDIVAGLADAYLSSISNRTNEVMKRLTVTATILMSVTLISSIYGMNFRYIPELNWLYGYPMALGLMVVVALGLSIYFKRRYY